MENKKGQGIFLGVVGVATLVVAIIGATFAFFSAQAQSENGAISGNTLDVSGTALKVLVEKVAFTGADSISASLVPAAGITATNTDVEAALDAKCQDDGYTGCHLYRITAKSTNVLSEAQLVLTLSTQDVNAVTDWKYVVFTGDVKGTTTGTEDFAGLTSAANNDAEVLKYTSTAGTAPSASGTAVAGNFSANNNVDIHNAQALDSTVVEYFLLIYLENQDHSQNQNTTASLNATGSYSGIVTLKAGTAGTVYATFSA